eukprot:403345418
MSETQEIQNKSLLKKFDNFFWRDYPASIAKIQLQPAPWANRHVLFATRLISAIFLVFISCYEFVPYNLAFFTHWGIYFSAATFTLLTIHEFRIRFDKNYQKQMDNKFQLTHSKPCSFYKWVVYFYQQTLVYESILVVFFWVVLYPEMVIAPGNTYKVVTTFVDHICPVTLLIIDFIQNRIHFSFKHLVVTQAVLTFYGFVNLTVTKVNHHPVYPILTFETVLSWLLAFTLPLLDLLFHSIYWLITKYRTPRYMKKDILTSTVSLDDNEVSISLKKGISNLDSSSFLEDEDTSGTGRTAGQNQINRSTNLSSNYANKN